MQLVAAEPLSVFIDRSLSTSLENAAEAAASSIDCCCPCCCAKPNVSETPPNHGISDTRDLHFQIEQQSRPSRHERGQQVPGEGAARLGARMRLARCVTMTPSA